MKRIILSVIAVAALAMGGVACKDKEKKTEEPTPAAKPVEQPAQPAQPAAEGEPAAAEPAEGEEPAAEAEGDEAE